MHEIKTMIPSCYSGSSRQGQSCKQSQLYYQPPSQKVCGMRQNIFLFNLLFFNTVGIVIVKLAINLSTFFSVEEAYRKSVCTIILFP